MSSRRSTFAGRPSEDAATETLAPPSSGTLVTPTRPQSGHELLALLPCCCGGGAPPRAGGGPGGAASAAGDRAAAASAMSNSAAVRGDSWPGKEVCIITAQHHKGPVIARFDCSRTQLLLKQSPNHSSIRWLLLCRKLRHVTMGSRKKKHTQFAPTATRLCSCSQQARRTPSGRGGNRSRRRPCPIVARMSC